MSSLLFLFGIIAFVLIVRWAIRNDNVGDEGVTFGIFAMNDQDNALAGRSDPRAAGRQGKAFGKPAKGFSSRFSIRNKGSGTAK